jgi:hypothetical protein
LGNGPRKRKPKNPKKFDEPVEKEKPEKEGKKGGR